MKNTTGAKKLQFHLDSSLYATLCTVKIMFCSATGAVKYSLPPAAFKSFLPSICSETSFPSLAGAFWCRTDHPMRLNFHTDKKQNGAACLNHVFKLSFICAKALLHIWPIAFNNLIPSPVKRIGVNERRWQSRTRLITVFIVWFNYTEALALMLSEFLIVLVTVLTTGKCFRLPLGDFANSMSN